MNRLKARLALLFCAVSLCLPACSFRQDPRFRDDTLYIRGFRGRENVKKQRRAPHGDGSYWDRDGVPGAPSIRISLADQKGSFYKGGQLVGVSVLSEGREGFGTPTGNFKIIQKDRDPLSNVYGDYSDAVTGDV